MALKLSGATGAIRVEAIELSNWLLLFGYSLEEFQTIISKFGVLDRKLLSSLVRLSGTDGFLAVSAGQVSGGAPGRNQVRLAEGTIKSVSLN